MRQALLLPLALFTGLLLIVASTGFQAGSTIHRGASHLLVVAMWLALPLSVLLPLTLRWRAIRRKLLAVCALVVAGLLIGLSILADSFTGYLILGMKAPEQDTLLRMKVLHRLGFPILLTLGMTTLWAISIVLARRVEAPGAEQGRL